MKFDEWSISESFDEQNFDELSSVFARAGKINYCGIMKCSRGLRTCKFHISVLELASYNNFK